MDRNLGNLGRANTLENYGAVCMGPIPGVDMWSYKGLQNTDTLKNALPAASIGLPQLAQLDVMTNELATSSPQQSKPLEEVATEEELKVQNLLIAAVIIGAAIYIKWD